MEHLNSNVPLDTWVTLQTTKQGELHIVVILTVGTFIFKHH